MGYSAWDHEESDTTEQLGTHTHTLVYIGRASAIDRGLTHPPPFHLTASVKQKQGGCCAHFPVGETEPLGFWRTCHPASEQRT